MDRTWVLPSSAWVGVQIPILSLSGLTSLSLVWEWRLQCPCPRIVRKKWLGVCVTHLAGISQVSRSHRWASQVAVGCTEEAPAPREPGRPHEGHFLSSCPFPEAWDYILLSPSLTFSPGLSTYMLAHLSFMWLALGSEFFCSWCHLHPHVG